MKTAATSFGTKAMLGLVVLSAAIVSPSFAATCEENYSAEVSGCKDSRDLCQSIYPIDIPIPFPTDDDRFFQCYDEEGNPITPGRSKRELCEWSYKNCERDAANRKDKCIRLRDNQLNPAPTPKETGALLSDEVLLLTLIVLEESKKDHWELSNDYLWNSLQQQPNIAACVSEYHTSLGNCLTSQNKCIAGCSSRKPTDPMEGPCKNESLSECIVNCTRMHSSCQKGAKQRYDQCRTPPATTP
jgi:hypothetical protein